MTPRLLAVPSGMLFDAALMKTLSSTFFSRPETKACGATR
jgi:hypothetical protein